MPRFWQDVRLPSGVHLYQGILITSLKLIFNDEQGKKRELKYENPDFPEGVISNELIQAAAADIRRIKNEIKRGNFIFEAWFPNSKNSKTKITKKSKHLTKFKDFIFSYYEILIPNKTNKELSPTTLMGYFSCAKNEFCNFFGDYYLNQISGEIIDLWIHSELKKGNAPHTIKNKISILNKIFLVAKLRNLIEINPILMSNLDGFKNLWKVDKNKPESFNVNLLKIIFRRMTPYERLLFSLWRYTGLRSSELCAAKKRNFMNGKLRIDRAQVRGVKSFIRNEDGNIIGTIKENIEKKNKTNAGKRFIQLSNSAIKIMEKLINYDLYKNNEYLFINPVTHKNFNNEQEIRLYWYKICDRVTDKMEQELLRKSKINPYKFRHTFCVEQFGAMKDPITIKTNMGHANLSQTYNYAEPASEFEKNS